MTTNQPHTTARVAVLPACDLCGLTATYDAKTTMGPWANLCGVHFEMYGIRLGLGFGQRLVLADPAQTR